MIYGLSPCVDMEDEEREETRLLIERLQELERVQAQQKLNETEQQSKKVHIGIMSPPECLLCFCLI